MILSITPKVGLTTTQEITTNFNFVKILPKICKIRFAYDRSAGVRNSEEAGIIPDFKISFIYFF